MSLVLDRYRLPENIEYINELLTSMPVSRYLFELKPYGNTQIVLTFKHIDYHNNVLFQYTNNFLRDSLSAVLGIRRSIDDPEDVQLASIVVVGLRNLGTSSPYVLKLCVVTDFYSNLSHFVVDGFPIYTVNSRIINLGKVKDYVGSIRTLHNL